MKDGSKGFTLVELMIVVAIIGIISAIIYPSYTQYNISTQRANAQGEMLQIARTLSSYKMANGNYAGRTLPNVYGSTSIPKQGGALYDLKLTDVGGTLELTASSANINTWLLVATPKTGTRQDGNGVIKLNDQGQKCWTKASNCTLTASSDWSGK